MRQACAVVLAGGQSTRFGSDKALARLRGEPLLAHALKGLCKAGFAQVAVAAKELASYAPVVEEVAHVHGVRIELLEDAHPSQTPLSGLAAALRASRHELVFACAADMPFAADPALIDALTSALEGHDAAVPEGSGALQPLCALWLKSRCAALADELLASPRPPGPRGLLPRLRWARLRWEDARPFLDADTPAALRELERIP
jgi:molybdopterin-guanine dinucleotide biosynthesis protein A